MKLDFSPQINAGHILNAAMILCVGVGGIVGVYLSLWTSIHDVDAKSIAATAAINARVLVLEAHRSIDDAFQAETRGKLDRVLEALAKLSRNDSAVGVR
jgi:hypothetical protein